MVSNVLKLTMSAFVQTHPSTLQKVDPWWTPEQLFLFTAKKYCIASLVQSMCVLKEIPYKLHVVFL